MEFIVNGKFVTEVLSVTEIMLRMCVYVNVSFMEALPARPRATLCAVLCKMR